LHITDDAVRLAVLTRLPWIRRQQGKFKSQHRQSRRSYVSGESHYFQGRRYRLNVVHRPGRPHVALRNSRTIDLFVPEGSDPAGREKIIRAWYRQQLKALIKPLIEKWEPVIGVEVAQWGVKQMKTKWGSCNAEAQRIWLNLELAKKPPPFSNISSSTRWSTCWTATTTIASRPTWTPSSPNGASTATS